MTSYYYIVTLLDSVWLSKCKLGACVDGTIRLRFFTPRILCPPFIATPLAHAFLPRFLPRIQMAQREPIISCTDQAPALNKTLTPGDAGNILEQLLEAESESFILGLRLNLRLIEVEAIQAKYSDPRERLLQILIAFLRQTKLVPTWRVILEALKSPVVGLTSLAARVEAALCSTDPTSPSAATNRTLFSIMCVT